MALYQCIDASFGLEICQELWLLNDNPGKIAYMNNADFVVSCNGSCFVTDKLKHRVDMVLNETNKMGGAYIYVNLIGCDGTSLYFDGGNIIAQNGELLGIFYINLFCIFEDKMKFFIGKFCIKSKKFIKN